MVSHLRFPPGMADGLLLAYPRTWLFLAVPFSQRNSYAPVHARSHLIDSGKWNLGHGQAFSIARSMKYIYRSWKPGMGFAPT